MATELICPTCEEAPRTLRGDLRAAALPIVIEDNNRLRTALKEIAEVKWHPWRCSYCGHYADVFAESCASCSKVGGYSGSHDRDRVACYRIVGEIAQRALTERGADA